jgi:hypothetical protein
MATHPTSVGRQGLKPLFFGSLNVAAELAGEKVAQPLLAVRFSRWIATRMRESPENRTARSGCATQTFPEPTFSAASEAATHKEDL